MGKVHKTSNGMEIPDWAIKSMASCLLPIIREYYSHEENCRACEEWITKHPEEVAKIRKWKTQHKEKSL